MFTVDDAGVKRAIAREQVSTPTAQSNEVLATIGRGANTTPASTFRETYSKLAPGYFYSQDLRRSIERGHTPTSAAQRR